MIGPNGGRDASVRLQPFWVESLEERRLLSVTVSSGLMVFNSIRTGSPGAGASAAQALTITNTGASPVTLGPSGLTIINDPSVATQDAGDFAITNLSGVPATLAAGASTSLAIDFVAPTAGLHAAILQVHTNDATDPLVNVGLRGLGTTGTGGANEPSLAAILRAYEIPTIVGDGPNDSGAFASTFYPTPPDATSREVVMPRLVKAGPGPVTISPLGTFAVSNAPTLRFGYYPASNASNLNELFSINQADAQTVHPTAQGATAFDPGSGAFGLYVNFPTFIDNGHQRISYSEDALNTWDTNVPRKIRFFPLENPDGTVVPNAFIFAAEDYNLQYDSNDIVGIIRNVAAAPGASTGGPSLSLQAVGGLPSSSQLVFNVISIPNASVGDTVHDTNTLALTNDGNQPLNITGLTLSDTTNWQLVSPPSLPATVAPGATLDVAVKFIATTDPSHTDNQTNTTAPTNGVSTTAAGGVWNGTLTIASNDPANPGRVVPLAGYWQYQSEHENEPGLQTIANMSGYGVSTGSTGTQPDLTEGATPVYYGQEIRAGLWQAADPTLPVNVQMIASFHTQGNTAATAWYDQGNSAAPHALFQTVADEGQSMLPQITGTSNPAAASFSPSGVFGFDLDGEFSEDNLNTTDIQTYGRSGHAVRFYALRGPDGTLVPNAWLMVQDYENSAFVNYDFQDLVYVVTNARPTFQPPAPADLTAVGVSGGVALQWQPAAFGNPVSYIVERGASANGTFTVVTPNPISATQFVDTTAAVGTTSYYRVISIYNGAESQGTGASATPFAAGAGEPVAPANLTATAATSGITLQWTAGATDAGFLVLRSSSASGPFVQLNGAPLTADTYVDATAPLDVPSFYEVVAVDALGNSSAPAANSATRPSAVSSTVSFSAGHTARYTDATGHLVTLRLTGPGTGQAIFFGSNRSPGAITISGSTARTTFAISVAGGGTTTTGTVTINGSLARLAANRAQLTGDLTIAGTLGAIQLAGASGGHLLEVRGGGRIASMQLGTVSGLSLTSAATIGTLQANAWMPSGGGTMMITAPAIARLAVAGNFAAGLTLGGSGKVLGAASIRGGLTGGPWAINGSTGTIAAASVSGGWAGTFAGPITTWTTGGGFTGNLTALSIANMNVRGSLSGSAIRLTSTGGTALRTLAIGGTAANSQVRTEGGSIGTVRAAALVSTDLFAGVADSVTGLPATLSDFARPASIGSVTISGAGQPFAVQNADVAATTLGRITFGALNTNNAGVPFGLAAHSLAAYTRRVGANVLRWTSHMSPALLTPSGDAVVRLV